MVEQREKKKEVKPYSKMMLASQGKKTDFLKTTFEGFLWIKTIYA